jgi:hypothetical protein
MMQSHAVSQQHNALLSQSPGGPSYQVNKLNKPWLRMDGREGLRS